MINFYNRFIPGAAEIMKPLYEASAKKNVQLQWGDDLDKAFAKARAALAKATMLRHPRPGAQIAVTADASGEAVGAGLTATCERGRSLGAFGVF